MAEAASHAAHDESIGETAVNGFLTTQNNVEEILIGITNSETLDCMIADQTEM